MGGYETDTTCQKTLDRFVKEMGDNYNDITITGHSKGGNLAQYATIKNGDRIDRCVSFDGQGFNKDFIAENKALIEANKDKITSINAYNDYVNILLTPIAGEIVYLNCNEDIPDSHSSYALWEANKGLTDENGDFNRHVKQSEDIVKLKEGLDDLIDSIGDLPDYMQKEIFSLLGTIAGLIFDHDLTDKEILRDVWKTLMQFEKTFHFRYPADFLTIMNLIKLLRELSKGDKKSSQSNRKKVARTAGNAARTTIKCKLSGFSRASEEMSSMSSRLINIASEIKANSANDDIQIARSINRCLDALNDYNHTIKNFSASLQSIKHLYDECESSIASEAFAAD
jgi:hypothetical protein